MGTDDDMMMMMMEVIPNRHLLSQILEKIMCAEEEVYSKSYQKIFPAYMQLVGIMMNTQKIWVKSG